MRKIDVLRKAACIGAAVLLLSACGQADKADPAPSETVTETSAEELSAQETADEKETEIKEDKEETVEETEKDTKEEDKEETSKEQDTKDKESQEDKDQESSSEKEEESSAAAKETAAESSAAQEAEKSVSDIYQEITQSVSLNSPMVVPDDFITNYYGIDVSTLDEYVFSMSEAAISAETVVILKAKDAGSIGALSASLQTVIDQKRAEMENYLPDQFQIVDKSSVQVKGNYVYLVISEQADAINQIIQADIQ